MFNFLQKLLEGIRGFTAELFTFKTECLCSSNKAKQTQWKKSRKLLITSRAANQPQWLGIVIFMRKKGNNQQLLANLLHVLLGWCEVEDQSAVDLVGIEGAEWEPGKGSAVAHLSQSTNFFGNQTRKPVKVTAKCYIFHTSIQKCRTCKSHLMLAVSCGKNECSSGWCQLQ